MLGLMRAEWLKLTKRPLTWVLLVIFLGLLLLQLVTQFVFVRLSGSMALNAALLAQLEEWRRRTLFPGIFGATFGHINGLGGIFAVILTAGAMGSEYSWGTLRTQIGRHPARAHYLLAKLLVLLALLVVAMIVTLLLGAISGGVLGAVAGASGALSAGDIAALPLAIIRALYVLLPYVLLTLCITVVGRSLLVGVAGGLLYLVFEAGFGALATLAQLGVPWRLLYNLTIQQNINTLVQLNSHTFGLHPEALTPALDITQQPSPLQATLVIAVYSVAFLATALYTLQRRDIAGAT